MKAKFLIWAISGMLLLCLASCKKGNEETITFRLRNNTSIDLTKVEVFTVNPSNNTQSILTKSTFEKGSMYQQVINVGALPNSDGGYKLQITAAAGSRSYPFGYFTNGRDLNEDYLLEIENDTVKVKPTIRNL